ncbi:MAG TPA: phosphopantetheine-binding protein [Pseudonocardiaceae bacterium]|jgi:acyl carrier protein|nr:phosphopantetheine-binding protein [Pseudonocardiaceae bacterium]
MAGSELDTAVLVDEQAVLADIAAMLADVLDEGGLGTDEIAEISLETTFRDDLDLESIDLVALGGKLDERYGERVNFAEFIADLDLEEIIALSVGELVGYILSRLAPERG